MEGNGPNRHFDAFRRPHPVQAVFSVLVLAVLAIPFVGMLWASTESTTENRTLAPLPSLVEEGSPNVTILSDLGAYFEDHYAYRNELVTANALIRTPLLSSPTDQVVIGTDGWLYYGGTLNDYLSTGTGSVRANRTVRLGVLVHARAEQELPVQRGHAVLLPRGSRSEYRPP